MVRATRSSSTTSTRRPRRGGGGGALPLDMHSEAFAAAEAARCAGGAGKFWVMRDALLKEGGAMDRSRLVALARGAGVPAGTFRACLDQHRFAAAIRRDVAEA